MQLVDALLQLVDPFAAVLDQLASRLDPAPLFRQRDLELVGSLPLGNKPALGVFDLLPQRGDRAFQCPQCLAVIIIVTRGSRTGNFADDLLMTPLVSGWMSGPGLPWSRGLPLVDTASLGKQGIVRAFPAAGRRVRGPGQGLGVGSEARGWPNNRVQ